MVFYALQIKSFPKIKAAFSDVAKSYSSGAKARKGELEVAFISGIKYTITTDIEEVSISDGSIVIIMPDTAFEGKSDEEGLYNASSVIAEFDEYEFERYDVNSPEEWDDVKIKTEGKILLPKIVPTGEETNEIKLHMHKIIMNFMRRDMSAELENIGLFCSMLAKFDAYVRKVMFEIGGIKVDASEAYMKKVKHYVDRYYAEKIKLLDVAKYAKASPSYIGKIIKNCTGKTFVEYVNHARVEKARRIFASNNKITAEQVAEMVGFCDERYMNIVFKKLTGFNIRSCRKMDALTLLSGKNLENKKLDS